jgi:hypothetical protein
MPDTLRFSQPRRSEYVSDNQGVGLKPNGTYFAQWANGLGSGRGAWAREKHSSFLPEPQAPSPVWHLSQRR